MRKHIAAIPALTGVLFFATVPALADQGVKTQGGDIYPAFSPSSITINPGETVTFMNADGGVHNVAWDDNAVPPSPSSSSAVWLTNPSRNFTVPGVYKFHCENHVAQGMSGKVTVVNPNSTPPPGTTPPADKTAPSLGTLRTSVGSKRVTLKFSSSEAGKASGKVERKNSHGTYKKFGDVSFAVKKTSSNSITVKKTIASRKLTLGKFRISFRVKDGAGNNSSKKTATFTITR